MYFVDGNKRSVKVKKTMWRAFECMYYPEFTKGVDLN